MKKLTDVRTMKKVIRMQMCDKWYILKLAQDIDGDTITTFVSILNKDLVIYSLSNTITENIDTFNIIPANFNIIRDLKRFEISGKYTIKRTHDTPNISVFHIVKPFVLEETDYMYKVLYDLTHNDDIDYVILSPIFANKADFTNFPKTGKIISYIDAPNKAFNEIYLNHKLFNTKLKVLFTGKQQALINTYSASRSFYIVK